MFNCASCKKTTKPNETCTQVVVEWRRKAYPAVLDRTEADKFGNKRTVMGQRGVGFETAKAVKVCPACVLNGAIKPALAPDAARRDDGDLSPVSTGLSTAPAPHRYIRSQAQEAAA